MQWKVSIEKMLQMLLRNTQNGAGYSGSGLTFWLALINLLVTSLTASCSRTSQADSLPVITSVRPSNTPAWTSPSQWLVSSCESSSRSPVLVWCWTQLGVPRPWWSACLWLAGWVSSLSAGGRSVLWWWWWWLGGEDWGPQSVSSLEANNNTLTLPTLPGKTIRTTCNYNNYK